MSTKKRSIPQIPPDASLGRKVFDTAVKETLEVITGRRENTRISKLPADASMADLVAKVNQIIDLLQE